MEGNALSEYQPLRTMTTEEETLRILGAISRQIAAIAMAMEAIVNYIEARAAKEGLGEE